MRKIAKCSKLIQNSSFIVETFLWIQLSNLNLSIHLAIVNIKKCKILHILVTTFVQRRTNRGVYNADTVIERRKMNIKWVLQCFF